MSGKIKENSGDGKSDEWKNQANLLFFSGEGFEVRVIGLGKFRWFFRYFGFFRIFWEFPEIFVDSCRKPETRFR
jgi:hypothetical protein